MMSVERRIKALECFARRPRARHGQDLNNDLFIFLAFTNRSLDFDRAGQIVAPNEDYQALADDLNKTFSRLGAIYLPIRPETVTRAIKHIEWALVAVDPATGFFWPNRQGTGMDSGLALDCGQVNGATIALNRQTGLERPRTIEGVKEFLTWLNSFGQTTPGYFLVRER